MIQKLFSVEPEGSVKGYPWFRGDIRDSPDPKEQNRSWPAVFDAASWSILRSSVNLLDI